MKKFFLQDTANWKFWITLALIVKGLFFCLLLATESTSLYPGFLGNISADTGDYLNPIENLIHNGIYAPDHRMPGYGVIYFPLLVVFSKTTALNIMILLQLLSAAAAVYLLAETAKNIFTSSAYFHGVFYFSLFSFCTNFYDHFLLTESFTCSFFIYSVYFFTRAMKEGRKLFYLLSGFFLMEVIFLRPVFFPLLFLFVIAIIWNNPPSIKINFIVISLFLLPMFIAEGMWINHNYKTHKKIQFLMDSFLPGDLNDNYHKPCLQFCQAWGGNYIWWKEGNPIRWFGVGVTNTGDSLLKLIHNEKIILPKNIYTSKFNEDSLIIVRNLISDIKDQEKSLSITERDERERIICDKLETYTQSIKTEHPFLYYLKAPIRYTKYFLLTTRANNPLSHFQNTLFIFLKKLELFFYLFILFTGLIGAILLFLKYWRNQFVWIITGIPVYTFLIHPVILRLIENRYLLPAFSFLILTSMYFLRSFYLILRIKIGKRNQANKDDSFML